MPTHFHCDTPGCDRDFLRRKELEAHQIKAHKEGEEVPKERAIVEGCPNCSANEVRLEIAQEKLEMALKETDEWKSRAQAIEKADPWSRISLSELDTHRCQDSACKINQFVKAHDARVTGATLADPVVVKDAAIKLGVYPTKVVVR